MGLHGLLRSRADDLVGIVNGIDDRGLGPGRRPRTSPRPTMPRRARRPRRQPGGASRQRFGLDPDPDALLCTVVSRLTAQKGLDLLLAALPTLLGPWRPAGAAGLGRAGARGRLPRRAAAHPGRVGCVFGYDEPLSHLLQGGADAILVPPASSPAA